MKNILRFRFSIRFMLALVMLLAILLASRNTLLCNYHEWALDRAASGSSSWYVGSFGGHMKELVRLGRYEQREFVLNSFTVDSQEAKRLFTQLRSVQVANAWFTMGPYGGDDAESIPDNITIICLPKKMCLYESLIEKADPSFALKTQ